jgi:hypothetical protein
MKLFSRLFFVVLAGTLCLGFGSSKIYGSEGKVSDSKGQPKSGAKIIAKQGGARFVSNKDGVVIDNKTGLQWAPDPDQEMTWDQATQYAKNLRLGGFSNWRLPTLGELRELGQGATDSAFKLKGEWAWSSEIENSSKASGFDFRPGKEDWKLNIPILVTDPRLRTLAVRSRK